MNYYEHGDKVIIRNFCFGLKNKQINYYLSKLPAVYKTCEVPILFVNRNLFGYLIFLFYSLKYNLGDRNYKDFLNTGGTSYYFLNTHKSTFIYCSRSAEKGNKEHFVFVLFHELRHWYQQTHLKQFHIEKRYYNLTIYDDNYSKQPLELDANKFAKKYAEKVGIRFIKVKGIDYVSANRSKLKN